MAELAKYRKPDDDTLPGVGSPVVSKPAATALDTGVQYGPPMAPFAPGGVRDQVVRDQGVPRTQVPPTAVGGYEGTIGVNLSVEDRQLKSNLQQIDELLASGATPTTEQAARIRGIREGAGFLRGGTDRVPVGADGLPLRQRGAGLQVSFDQTVPSQARQAFLADPARPTAQIDRFDATMQNTGQGVRAAQNAGKILGLNKNVRGDGDLFTKENSPGMGWKERKELNQQLLTNQQSEANAQTQAGTSAAGFRNQADIAKLQEGAAAERNRIAAEDLASQTEARGVASLKDKAETAKIKQEVEQGKLIKTREQYVGPDKFTVLERDVLYNPVRKEVVRPSGGVATLAQDAAALTPSQRGIAAKYIKQDQTDAEKSTILAKVKSGELN